MNFGKLVITFVAAAMLAACLGLSSGRTAAVEFTPITIPPQKVITPDLRSAISSTSLKVQISSLSSGSGVVSSGIEIGNRWHLIGVSRFAFGPTYGKKLTKIVSIRLTPQGLRLLDGRASGRIRLLVWGAGHPEKAVKVITVLHR